MPVRQNQVNTSQCPARATELLPNRSAMKEKLILIGLLLTAPAVATAQNQNQTRERRSTSPSAETASATAARDRVVSPRVLNHADPRNNGSEVAGNSSSAKPIVSSPKPEWGNALVPQPKQTSSPAPVKQSPPAAAAPTSKPLQTAVLLPAVSATANNAVSRNASA